MRRIHATLALAFVIAAILAPAWAQRVPMRGPIPFSVFDRNGDGLVDKQEFDAAMQKRLQAREDADLPTTGAFAPPEFVDLDTNGDGRLDQDEWTAGQLELLEDRRGAAGGARPRAEMARSLPTFTDFDLDDNGVITAAEFDQARSARTANLGQPGYRLRHLPLGPTFAEIDTDGDGKIVPEEFAAHQSQRIEKWLH